MNSEDCLKTWNIYQKAWGPVEEAERRDLLSHSVSNNIVYTDPGSQVEGVDALVTRIAGSQKNMPGASFKNDTFLEHHGQGLFNWTMYSPDGSIFLTGSSFGRFGDDGRLVEATGFFKTPKS